MKLGIHALVQKTHGYWKYFHKEFYATVLRSVA